MAFPVPPQILAMFSSVEANVANHGMYKPFMDAVAMWRDQGPAKAFELLSFGPFVSDWFHESVATDLLKSGLVQALLKAEDVDWSHMLSLTLRHFKFETQQRDQIVAFSPQILGKLPRDQSSALRNALAEYFVG
jgi:hypothetical protein